MNAVRVRASGAAMTIFDQIREDEEKGTPGPWTFEIETGDWPDQYLIDGNGDPVLEWDFDLGFRISAPNARRIARVPQLERIALAAEELAKAVQKLRVSPIGVSPEVHEAARKFNEATQ